MVQPLQAETIAAKDATARLKSWRFFGC